MSTMLPRLLSKPFPLRSLLLRSPLARKPPTSILPPIDRRNFSSASVGLNRSLSSRIGNSGRGGGGGRGNAWTELRNRINSFSDTHVLIGLIGLNVSIYGLWQYAESSYTRFRDPSLYNWMGKHFTTSVANLKSGRIWTLLTSCFSHGGGSHLLVNMASLYFCAGPVMSVLGNVGFISLYLFSGVASTTFSLIFNSFYTGNPRYASHGASGAVYGTLAWFAALNPTATVLLFFVVPVPIWLCVSGLFAYDAYGSFGRSGGTTDSAGHMGGVLGGLAFFFRKLGRF